MKTDQKNATIPIGGDALLVNNKWGEGSLLPGEVYEQTIAEGEISMNGLPWWRWACNTQQPSVKGYPSILYGNNPHSGLDTTSSLPERLFFHSGRPNSDKIDLDYSLKVKADGEYNVMVDLWITSGPEATKEQITYEVMIVLGGGKWTPQKYRVGDAVVGGRIWIASAYDHPRANHRCIVFEYDADYNQTSGVFPIHEVLDWCRRWAGLRDGYLACVLLGTEIKNGSGMCIVERFEVVWS